MLFFLPNQWHWQRRDQILHVGLHSWHCGYLTWSFRLDCQLGCAQKSQILTRALHYIAGDIVGPQICWVCIDRTLLPHQRRQQVNKPLKFLVGLGNQNCHLIFRRGADDSCDMLLSFKYCIVSGPTTLCVCVYTYVCMRATWKKIIYKVKPSFISMKIYRYTKQCTHYLTLGLNKINQLNYQKPLNTPQPASPVLINLPGSPYFSEFQPKNEATLSLPSQMSQ